MNKKPRNFVHINMIKFSTDKIHKDKKKEQKNGYIKHNKRNYDE